MSARIDNSKVAAITLGELLYGEGRGGATVDEAEWQQLVRAMAGGDAQALHALHERSHRIVFTLLIRLVGDQRTAEELTLKTYQRAWQEAARFRSGSVLGWLLSLANDEASRLVPRDSRADMESRQRLRDAVARLTNAERQLFELVYFSSDAVAAVASRLGESEDSVTARLHAVLQKLCEAFAASDQP